jgi:chromosome partitioning protein
MPILLMLNFKGGVAKTTNAVAMAECFAANKLRTLLIDADHQCMAGEMLLGESRLLRADRTRTTFYDLLTVMLEDEFDADQTRAYVQGNASNIASGLPNLSVIPCSLRIEDISTNMAKARRGYRSNDEFLQVLRRHRKRLRRWLENHYDMVLVDCPPSLALQVKVLLGTADGFIVPCVPDRLSVRGSIYLMHRLATLGFKSIRPVGTLWSLYRVQNRVHQQIVTRARQRAEPYDKLPVPFETVIPNAAAISDATDPDARPASFRAKYTREFADLYEKVCDEVMARVGWPARLAVQPTAHTR